MLDKYESHLRSLEKSGNTLYAYRLQLQKLAEYLAKEYGVRLTPEGVGAVKGYMLDSYYQTLDSQSPSTKNYYVIVIRGFFSWLKDSGYIESDPSGILHRVRQKKNDSASDEDEAKAYAPEEVVRLIRGIKGCNKKRDIAIVASLAGGGYRASELCELTVGTFRNRKNGRMYIHRKGNVWKWVPLADFALPYVEDYLAERGEVKEDEPLFLSRTGEAMDRHTLWKILSRHQHRLGMKTGVHIMRHTYLTEAAKHSGEAIARDLASHSSLSVTNAYIHTTADEQRKAANSVGWAKALS